MKEAMIVAGLVITILLTILYFVILYVWPEWVGISGKDSKKTRIKKTKSCTGQFELHPSYFLQLSSD